MTRKVSISFGKLSHRLARAETYVAPNTRQEKKAKNVEKDDEGNEHLIYAEGCGGNILRGNGHPYWGYRYMIGKCDAVSAGIDDANRHEERRDIYKPTKFVSQVYDEKIATVIKFKYGFSGGGNPAANFSPQAKNPTGGAAGQGFPYSWQSHHLIPQEIFTSKDSAFNADDIKVIVASGYNINHGHNIIFLPGNGASEYVPVHGLAQHVGSHPKYTNMVKLAIDLLATELKPELKKAKNRKKHEKLEVNILKEIRNVEQELWKEIVAASQLLVEEKLKDGADSIDFLTDRENWFKLG